MSILCWVFLFNVGLMNILENKSVKVLKKYSDANIIYEIARTIFYHYDNEHSITAMRRAKLVQQAAC